MGFAMRRRLINRRHDVKVAALYQFAPLPDFRELREPLRALCAARVKGSCCLPRGHQRHRRRKPDGDRALIAELRDGALFGGRLDNLELKFSAPPRCRSSA